MHELAPVSPFVALAYLVSGVLFILALLIHFILLSTDRFNWLEGPKAPRAANAQTLVLPQMPA